MKPQQSLADHADDRRRNPTTTLTTICLSLRNNAALLHSLCVICVICGRIFTQAYSIYIAHRNPMCLPQISQIIADKPQKPQ